MFGDNKSVVMSSTIPHSTLGKRWNALSYHRVREAVAGGWVRFEHIPGTENPADILTKPLPWFSLKVNCFQPGSFNNPCSFAYTAHVTGSHFPMTVNGSHVVTPASSHSILTL